MKSLKAIVVLVDTTIEYVKVRVRAAFTRSPSARYRIWTDFDRYLQRAEQYIQ